MQETGRNAPLEKSFLREQNAHIMVLHVYQHRKAKKRCPRTEPSPPGKMASVTVPFVDLEEASIGLEDLFHMAGLLRAVPERKGHHKKRQKEEKTKWENPKSPKIFYETWADLENRSNIRKKRGRGVLIEGKSNEPRDGV